MPGRGPIDPRERELLDMLSEYLAVAIRNSHLYGEMAERAVTRADAGDAIISVDRDGKIQRWNEAATLIFGSPRSRRSGAPLSVLLPEEAYAEARTALSPAEPVRRFEVTTKRDDGRALSLSVTLSALPGRGEALEGILAIIRDTTTEKELEAQMHQSEKLTALGQMAGGIAHDFNNLLQAILGYAQLMGKNPRNADVVRRGLQVIEKAATGGAETVRRIQKFARLRPEEPFVGLDLEQVIRDALAMTHPRWEEKRLKAGVPLELELDLKPVPVVMGRPAELNEVVTNLVLNAIDAMPQGGTLRLHTRSQIATRGSHGNGHGHRHDGGRQTADLRPILHDQRRGRHRARPSGLVLHREAPRRRHRGRQPSGRREHVHGRTCRWGRRPRPRRRPTPSPSAQRTGRVLLVDNDPQVMTILGEMLQDAGHHVVPVSSGAEALRIFAPRAFDVVVTNIGMVEMSGWELVDQLRSRDAGVPVVFITGWGMQEQDQARCRGLGIFSVLFKPVRPAELYATVQSALAERDEPTRAYSVPD